MMSSSSSASSPSNDYICELLQLSLLPVLRDSGFVRGSELGLNYLTELTRNYISEIAYLSSSIAAQSNRNSNSVNLLDVTHALKQLGVESVQELHNWNKQKQAAATTDSSDNSNQSQRLQELLSNYSKQFLQYKQIPSRIIKTQPLILEESTSSAGNPINGELLVGRVSHSVAASIPSFLPPPPPAVEAKHSTASQPAAEATEGGLNEARKRKLEENRSLENAIVKLHRTAEGNGNPAPQSASSHKGDSLFGEMKLEGK
jgi:histone H3/H4